MVLFLLFMKAETENVGEIELRSDVNLRMSVRNSLSEYEIRENIVFNRSQTVEQCEGTREPPYHFSLRWEGSKKPSYIRALDDKEIATALKKKKKYKGGPPRKFTGDDSDVTWVPLCAFECRGMEPYAFHPMTDEFIISSEHGYRFEEDIELEDGEWADYDADNDCPVSIQDVKFKFEAV